MSEPINVYGINLSAEEIAQRKDWHETTYLEWEIPVALDDELSDFIEQKIKEFEEKCGCGLCKLHKRD